MLRLFQSLCFFCKIFMILSSPHPGNNPEVYIFIHLLFIIIFSTYVRTSLGAHVVKNLPVMQETQVQSLGVKISRKGMATHSSILAWRIPWTEETGRSQRVGHY